MILPTKHIPLNYSLLGIGAILLKELSHPMTVTALWDKVRIYREIGTYNRFIMALDMLYLFGAVEFQAGLLQGAAMKEVVGSLVYLELGGKKNLKDFDRRIVSLTKEISELSNDNWKDRQALDLYQDAANEEATQEPSVDSIERLYAESSVVLAAEVTKQLHELQQFHKQIIENRKQFLSDEIEEIKKRIQERDQEISNKAKERSQLLAFLQEECELGCC